MYRVDNLHIQSVFDHKQGERRTISEVQKLSLEGRFQLRYQAEHSYQIGEKFLDCDACGNPIGLRGGKESNKRQLHFVHRTWGDSQKCPLYQGNSDQLQISMSERFQHCNEGDLHKNLKEKIFRLLKKDPKTSYIKKEKEVVDKVEGRSRGFYRRCDVYAIWNNMEIGFEIQRSTINLETVVGKDKHYQKNGVHLIWVFPYYLDGTFTSRDVYYSHFKNIFFLDKDDTEHLFFGVKYEKPYRELNSSLISKKWEEEEVIIDDLTFDESYRPYYSNYEDELQEINLQIEREKEEEAAAEKIRREVEEIQKELCSQDERVQAQRYKRIEQISSKDHFDKFSNEIENANIVFEAKNKEQQLFPALFLKSIGRSSEAYNKYIHKNPTRNEIISLYCNKNLSNTFKYMLSAYYGVPVGYKFRNLKQVFHTIHFSMANGVKIFIALLELFGNLDPLTLNDKVRQKILALEKEGLRGKSIEVLAMIDSFLPGFSDWFFDRSNPKPCIVIFEDRIEQVMFKAKIFDKTKKSYFKKCSLEAILKNSILD